MAKTSLKDKYHHALAKLRGAGGKAKAMGGKIKPFAYAGVGGAGGYYLHKFAADKIGFVNDHWYGGPLVMLGAAWVVAKKSREAALGLAGAAGYAGAQLYDMQKDNPNMPNPGRPPQGQGGNPPPAPGPKPAGTKGPDEAGFVQEPGATGGPDMSGFSEAGAPGDYELDARRRRPGALRKTASPGLRRHGRPKVGQPTQEKRPWRRKSRDTSATRSND